MTTTTASTLEDTTAAPTAAPTDSGAVAVAETSNQPVAAPQPVFGILSLVFGIAGIALGLVVPLSVAGLVLGILALSREPQARTMAIWGIALCALPGVLVVLVGVLAAVVLIPLGALAAFAL